MKLTIKVPEIKFTKIRPYEHRVKKYYNTGLHGHLHENGHITLHQNGHSSYVVNADTWRIGLTNISSTPVNVTLLFTAYDQYGALHNFAEVFRNIRPRESVDSFVTTVDKNVMFDSVEVHDTGDKLISRTEVKQPLPRMPWGVKSWIFALLMAFIATMSLIDTQPNNNVVNMVLPVAAIIIMTFGLLKRTPVLLMIAFIAAIPFSNHVIDAKVMLLLAGLAYLYFVWRKRSSVKDFFRASSSPVGRFK